MMHTQVRKNFTSVKCRVLRFHQFRKPKVFREAESCPSTQEDIDGNGEKYDPWRKKKNAGECLRARQEISDERNEECFGGENERGFVTLLDLCGDELLNQGDHDEKWEDGNGSESGAMKISASDQDAENNDRNNSEGDGNTRKIEEAQFTEEESREHADENDAHENGDAIFEPARIKSKKSEGDDRRRVDTERLDADHLSEKGNERDDKWEHEYVPNRINWHALIDKVQKERMKRHRRRMINFKF